jgi:hypothetical protein
VLELPVSLDYCRPSAVRVSAHKSLFSSSTYSAAFGTSPMPSSMAVSRSQEQSSGSGILFAQVSLIRSMLFMTIANTFCSGKI